MRIGMAAWSSIQRKRIMVLYRKNRSGAARPQNYSQIASTKHQIIFLSDAQAVKNNLGGFERLYNICVLNYQNDYRGRHAECVLIFVLFAFSGVRSKWKQ